LVSDPALERTIDKILGQTESEILSGLKESLSESQKTLENSKPKLEQEFDKIITEGKKEAEKLQKQIIGSSDLEARNKQLLLVQESVEKVFNKAIDQIKNTARDANYSKLISKLLEDSTKILGTTKVTVFTNSKDKEIVKSELSKFSGAELSNETIDCLGGVQVKSKDGSMTFDNTIDARIERMKPLIRKEVATKFGIGN
jgi:V/A-type H+/Na+-transporting ATPase subunit E